MKQHVLSQAFPAMSPIDLLSLSQDIEAHGLKSPVVIFEGQVLDGWHRFSACLAAGVMPDLVELPAGEDPVAYVMSMNMNRRHLTASQRAAAVVACADWRPVGSNQHTGGSAPGAEALAEQADVSERTIRHAKAAQDAGLGEAVRDGEVSAKRAAEVAKLPKRERKQALENPRPKAEEPDEDPGSEDQSALLEELSAQLEAAERIIEADDKVAAVYLEVKAMRAKHDAIEKLYNDQRAELRDALQAAKRWQKKAEEGKKS